ncbi:MAG: hypothetical protein HUU55_10595 [Myxococcales bacterium]|nr:hypothetical protein [Myxococcales bacterium]
MRRQLPVNPLPNDTIKSGVANAVQTQKVHMMRRCPKSALFLGIWLIFAPVSCGDDGGGTSFPENNDTGSDTAGPNADTGGGAGNDTLEFPDIEGAEDTGGIINDVSNPPNDMGTPPDITQPDDLSEQPDDFQEPIDLTETEDSVDVVESPEDVLVDTGNPIEDIVEDIGTPPEDIVEEDIVIVVPPTFGSVEGVVWDLVGNPINKAAVRIIGNLEIATQTDSQGLFSLSNVPTGDRQVWVGPTINGIAAVADVVIQKDKKTNAGIITLETTGEIEGQVIAKDSEIQQGTVVRIPGTTYQTITNAQGFFLLIDVPPYCPTIVFERPGYQTEQWTGCLEPDGLADTGLIELYKVGICIPQCKGKECGSDGCGAECGQCFGQQICNGGKCEVGGECGNATCEDTVGETCANCPADCICDDVSVCLEEGCCTPDCAGKECGNNGCGGTCGACSGALSCNNGLCLLAGGSCGNGTCEANQQENCKTCAGDCKCAGAGVCSPQGVCCTPQCSGKNCGPDGCGGSCGDCQMGFTCESGKCSFVCSEVTLDPKPDVGPMPITTPVGKVDTSVTEGYQDEYLSNSAGTYKVAIRKDWGGSLVYFGPATGASTAGAGNRLDVSNGTRGSRVALFDVDRAWQGCAYNAGCTTNPAAACPQTSAFLGWNPRQGVNECGSLPTLSPQDPVAGLLMTSGKLLQWNPDFEAQGCVVDGCLDNAKKSLASNIQYSQSVRFVAPTTLEIQMTFQNTGTTTHVLTAHELPAIFGSLGTNGTKVLDTFVTSKGVVITPDVALADGSLVTSFDSPDGWAAIQTKTLSDGLALVFENNAISFTATKKTANGAFNKLSGAYGFAIGSKATVRMRAYLLIGAFSSLELSIANLKKSMPPFGALEEPQINVDAKKTVKIKGWALDNVGIKSAELLIDGKKVSNLYVNQKRDDICAQYPGYPNCPNVGFVGAASMAGYTKCKHIVSVSVTDVDNNTRIVAEVPVAFQTGVVCTETKACEDGDPCSIDLCDPELGCVAGPKPENELVPETCNAIDDDCDGQLNEAPAIGCLDYYEDADKDGYGSNNSQCLCAPSGAFNALLGGDCDDTKKAIYPLAKESCNDLDDDCDGQVDEEGATGCVLRFPDLDGDGFGTGSGKCTCKPLDATWTALKGGDCDDSNVAINGGKKEICNDLDDDCNGTIDDEGVCPPGTRPIHGYSWVGADKIDTDTAWSTKVNAFPSYQYKGVTFLVLKESAPGLVPLYQSYCALCTDHMPHVIPNEGGAKYANPVLLGYCGASQSGTTPEPLYRLYGPAATDWVVTSSLLERDAYVAQGFIEDAKIFCWVPTVP